jgi:hypothetical protein
MSKKGVIRILKESFSILRKYPLIFVPYLGLAVISLILRPMRDPLQGFLEILDFYRGVYSSSWTYLLSFIGVFVIAMVITMTYTFHREKVRMSLQKALGSVRSKVSRLIGVGILLILIQLIVFLIGVVLVMMGVSLELTVLEYIGNFIFYILFILVFIFFAFVYHGIIIDNMGVTETFKNSYRMAKDNFWTIIGVVLVAFILISLLSIITGIIIGIINIFHEIQMPTMNIISKILTKIFSSLFACYLLVAFTLLYILRKTGND